MIFLFCFPQPNTFGSQNILITTSDLICWRKKPMIIILKNISYLKKSASNEILESLFVKYYNIYKHTFRRVLLRFIKYTIDYVVYILIKYSVKSHYPLHFVKETRISNLFQDVIRLCFLTQLTRIRRIIDESEQL